jgi:ADP-heptose:LPS heptosyltransferase
VIHPGAATALQRWPGMSALGERLAARTAFPWRTVEAAEAFDAPALARLIGGARAFVGGHSGPLHLAALLGVPHVAVAGPSAVAWDPPWPEVPGRILRAGLACQPCGAVGAPARACVQDAPARGRPGDAPPPCLTAWTPEAVAAAVEEVLDGR